MSAEAAAGMARVTASAAIVSIVRMSRRLAAGQELPHALERLEDVLGRVGVGQPDVAFAEDAEVRPADGNDTGVVEQRGGEFLGFPARARDIGKGIKRALRHNA